MLLLFALYLTLARGAPLPPPTSDSPGYYALLAFRDTASESPNANARTIWDIIWSCAATILACTWTALHPNIPGPHDSGWRRFKRRAVMTFYAVIAPEVVSLWALIQYTGARNAMKDYNGTVAKNTDKPAKKTITQSAKEWFYSIPEPKSQGIQPWTMSHAFFALMGGFLLYDELGQPVQVLNYARLKKGIQDGTIDPPDITEDEIQDRSKGDFLSKGIVVLQTSWFVLQCVSRWAQRLPLSSLEVVTLEFALLNGITYALWWHKPQDVGKAFRLARKANARKLDEKSPEVVHLDTSREPTDSDSLKPPIQSMPEIPIDSVARISTPLAEPFIFLPPIRSSGDPTAPIPDADETQPEPENPPKNAQPAAEDATSTPHPVYAKVRYIRRKLLTDRSKLDGRWTRILWFYGIMIPFRLVCYSLYTFLKMLEPDFPIADGALRVSMYGSDALDDEAYGEIVFGSFVIGTLFGAVHFIAWAAPFPTSAEHLLWRIATVYIAAYPNCVVAAFVVAAVLSEYFNLKKAVETALSVLVAIIWIGAGIYGLCRSVVLLEAVLSLRGLASAVYQDVEWTVFIPHL